jgi:hypothetical protein
MIFSAWRLSFIGALSHLSPENFIFSLKCFPPFRLIPVIATAAGTEGDAATETEGLRQFMAGAPPEPVKRKAAQKAAAETGQFGSPKGRVFLSGGWENTSFLFFRISRESAER